MTASASDQEELWFDFLADTGDGFNPTSTTARLLAQEKLELVHFTDAATRPTRSPASGRRTTAASSASRSSHLIEVAIRIDPDAGRPLDG